MPEHPLLLQVRQFWQAVDAADYEQAAQQLKQFELLLAQQPELLQQATRQEVESLTQFQADLQSRAAQLETEAIKLVDQISPFNKNSTLNKVKFYRND